MLFVARGLLALGTLLTPCDAFAADVALFDAQDAPPSLLSHCWSAGALAGTERERRSTANRSRVNLDALRAVARPNRIAVPKALRGSIRSVTIPNDEKLIALTFDLCESSGRQSGYDGEVIDYLRAENVRATLFVSGKWFESHPERSAQLIADEALEIGGHGFYHRDFSRASQATLHDEIHLTEAAFLRARGRLLRKSCAWNRPEILSVQEDLKLMRFPFGWCNTASLSAVAEAGQLAVQWNIVTGDPDPRLSAKRIAKTIVDQAHPGAIVIGHANGKGRNTTEALKIAVPELKDQGYRFVTVSELLAAGDPVIVQSCYTERPGDRRYHAKVKKRLRAQKK